MSDESPQPRSWVGRRIGTYEVLSRLGAGGMGEVYRAHDSKLGRDVAIKFVADDLLDPTARKRIRQEARTASSLNHPHILTVHDVGELDGRDYLVTELVDGGTLRDWASARARTPQDIVDLMTGVADALASAHDAHVIHRDIKPENILVGSNGYAKLADFGLAKSVQPAGDDDATRMASMAPTQAGAIVGTYAYMSPEQAAGLPLDARSDIFSFGILLYELLAGRRPFTGDTPFELLRRIRDENAPPLGSNIEPPLRAIVEKALQKDPSKRYQSIRELVRDLRSLTRGSGTNARGTAWRWAAAGVALAALLAAGVWTFRPKPSVPRISAIAVLPLRNVSGAADEEYFSAATTEQLISELSRIRDLKVISRTSVLRYKESTKPIPEIAKELGVDAVLEGAIQKSGARVRLNARLVQASTDRSVWAQDFDRPMTDILDLESELARSIASAIRMTVTSDEVRRLGNRRVDPAAFDAYLRGRYLTWNFNAKDIRESTRYYEEAIRIQPDLAAAHAGIAFNRVGEVNLGFAPASEVEQSARAAAARALELAPDLPDAHEAMGDVLQTLDRKFPEAEKEFKRAIELDPTFVDARNDYAYFLVLVGRLPEALDQVERATALDPLSAGLHVTYALALARSGRYAEAEEHVDRALELDPADSIAAGQLISIAEYRGDPARALRLLEPTLKRTNVDTRNSVTAGRLFAKLGRTAEARDILARVTHASEPGNPQGIATLCLALGENDAAFDWLRKAADSQRLSLTVKTDPLFAAIRPDPRFQDVLRKMGLPPD